MIYYVVFLGLMTLENVREVLTVEYSTSFINKTKGKESDQGHISDQIQRNSQLVREAYQENKDKQIFKIRGRQRTRINAKKQDDMESDERIVGGSTIDIKEAPSYVIIEIMSAEGYFLCAGNILSNCFILTAAHCVSTKNFNGPITHFQALDTKLIKVILGATSYKDHSNLMKAKRIWIHPQYLKDGKGLNRDIAVVQTSKELIFSNTMQMAHIHPLLHVEDSQMKKCSVAGWGKTETDERSENLRQVMVNLIPHEECEAMMKGMVYKDAHVCALNDGKDACNGDSGAGLFCDGMLLAVTSWGMGCGKGNPGVYARVDNALDFILPILNEVKCKSASFSPPLITLLNLLLLHFIHY